MTKTKTISLLNLLSFLAMLAINALATFSLLGSSTNELAEKMPALIMPIGLTFAIVWTMIYLLLALYTGYQLLNPDNKEVADIGIYFLLTNILNMLWILAYHGKLILISVIVILGLFTCLFLLNRKLKDGNLLTRIAFGMYYGWISVASVVSIFSYISSINMDFYDSAIVRALTCISLIVLMLLTFVKSKDYAYVFTVIFAMVGVLLRHLMILKGSYPEIVIILIVTILMSLFALFMTIMESKDSYRNIKEGSY